MTVVEEHNKEEKERNISTDENEAEKQDLFKKAGSE